MDLRADIGRVVEDTGNEELLDTLFAAINEAMSDQPNQPHQTPPSPLPPVTAGLELKPEPQPVDSQGAYYGACLPTGADLRMFEQQHPVMAAPNMYGGSLSLSLHQAHNMQPAHLHGQTGAYSQGQWPVNNILTAPAISHPAAPAAPHQTYLPYQWPVNNVVKVPAIRHPAAPQQTYLPYQWPVNNVLTEHAVSRPAAPQQTYLPHQWPVNNVVTAPAISRPAAPQQTYLPHQWPVNNVLRAPIVSPPAAPQQTVIKLPVVTLTEGQGLRCVGMLNGVMVYEVTKAEFPPHVSAYRPLNASGSKKRKRVSQQEDDQQYVKKPLNAFMLFLKEQKSTAEIQINFRGKGGAAINTFLGQRWTSLTAEQQAKYYEQAAKERRLHAEQHPNWSSKNNYGKKSDSRKDPSRAEASASKPGEDTRQAKNLCVTPVQTVLMESSTQVHEISPASWLDSPATASTLASPAAPTQTQTESTNSENFRG